MIKKLIILIMIIVCSSFVFAYEPAVRYEFVGGDVTINSTLISGTNISCNDVVGASYDVCTGSASSGAGKSGDGIYLYNTSDTMYFNESLLNSTIDSRAVGVSDGNNYSSEIGLTLAGLIEIRRIGMTNLSLNIKSINTWNTTSDMVAGANSTGYLINWSTIIVDTDTDTTIGNCSVDGSCNEIMYYSNISNIDTDTNTWNTTEDMVTGANTTGYLINWSTLIVDTDTNTFWSIITKYLFNNSGSLDLNETQLNFTIDARDSDTTYSTISPLNQSGTIFGLASCSDTFVYAYNLTFGGWQCQPKVTAGGGTVTSVSGDGFYVTGTITDAGTFGFNETNLNSTITARSELTDTDTNTQIGNCSVDGSCDNIIYATNTSWITDNQNKFIYSDFFDQYLNKTSNVNFGTLNTSNTTYSYGTSLFYGNMFIDDIAGKTHHINVDLENLDELYANVFLTPLDIETFYNASGDYINITAANNETSITVNLANSTGANNYRLNYTNIILPLTNGSNKTPILNRVYIKLVGQTPTWEVSITEPTFKHAMASRILLGDTGTYPISASLQEDGQSGFLKRVQRRLRNTGLLYESGLDFNSSETSLSISSGQFINGIYDSTINGDLNTSDAFYVIYNDGTYHKFNSFAQIQNYSDGSEIGNNKYFNVIFGITPYDGTGNIFAIVQDEPTTEYSSVSNAYADSQNTVNIYPEEEFLKIFFLPVARVVINNNGDNAELLPNGDYAVDYRGGIAGGVSSGGGLSESDPVWTADKPSYALLTDVIGNCSVDGSCNNIIYATNTSWLNTTGYLINWSTLIVDTDTTIGNCSVDGSCNEIMYYSNISNIDTDTNTWNTTEDMVTGANTTGYLINWSTLIVDTDTTIGNCSVDGSCNEIMYYSNISNIDTDTNTWNTTEDMVTGANTTGYLINWSTLIVDTDTDTTIGNCSSSGSCTNVLYTNSNFGGDVTGTYDAIVVTPNSTTLSCSNITGATSDLCTITSGSSSLWVDGGTYLYPNSTYADDVNVTGNFSWGDRMSVITDLDTYIWAAADDQLEFYAGGISFIHLIEGAGDGLTFNQDSNDIDFRVESNDYTHAFYIDGETGYTRISNLSSCELITTDSDGIMSCGTDIDTTIGNCSVDGSCDNVVYDSDTTYWDKDTSNNVNTTTQFGGEVSGDYGSILINKSYFHSNFYNKTLANETFVKPEDDVKFNTVNVTDGNLTVKKIILDKAQNMCILVNGTQILISNNLDGVTC